MTNILDRLKHWASIQADGSQFGADLREGIAEMERHATAVDDKSADIATLQQSLSDKDDEIERLKSVAGAVSSGKSFAEIKAEAKTQPVDPAANEPNS